MEDKNGYIKVNLTEEQRKDYEKILQKNQDQSVTCIWDAYRLGIL